MKKLKFKIVLFSAYCLVLLPTSSFSQYECNDGIDNDGDGLIDYPEDPGCFSDSDDYEGVYIYDSSNPPSVPGLVDLPLITILTKDGITWTFSEPERVGRFITGDPYVVGPVTVIDIDPLPSNGRNGSMLNRSANVQKTGFDDRTPGARFDPSLFLSLPITINPGNSLLSSISDDNYGVTASILRSMETAVSPVQSISILTSLANPVAPDAFRPTYCDGVSDIYYSRNFDRTMLPHLDPVQNTRELSEFETYLRRPWVDVLFFNFDAPNEYAAQYGRENARVVGMSSLLLSLNFSPEEKEPLLVYLTQYGIDLFGCIKAGHNGWTAFGGHGSGRKMPIVFAGALLGEVEMATVSDYYPNSEFGDDMQTMHDQGWTGATAVYAGHRGVNGTGGEGLYEHLQPKDWPFNPGPNYIGENYRRCCTSISWIGEALGARLIGFRCEWNHPPFFDYADRWMTEDDSAHRQIIENQIGVSYSSAWQWQRQAWDSFVEEMWDAYRDSSKSCDTSTIGIQPQQNINDQPTLTVFPNPNKGVFTIKNNPLTPFFKGEGQVSITDMYGRVVYAAELNNNLITLDGSAGLYFVSIVADEGKTVIKLVIE